MLVWSKSTTAKTTKIIRDDQRTLDVVLDMPARPPLAEVSLALGDAIHNARASLDALTWELAHQDGAKPTRPTRVQFPICLEERMWRDVARDLSTVPPIALERIRSVQPFLEENPSTTALSYLHQLDIRDKHRTSLECLFRVEDFSLDQTVISFVNPDEIPHPPVSIDFVNDGVLNDGDVVMRLTSTARMQAAKVPAAMGFNVMVQFDEGQIELGQLVNAVMQSVPWVHEVIRYGLAGAKHRAELVAQHGVAEPMPAAFDDASLPEEDDIEWDVDLREPS
jgi:hypothetical protein